MTCVTTRGGRWKLHVAPNLDAAVRFLDALEETGHECRRLVVLGDARFAVLWR